MTLMNHRTYFEWLFLWNTLAQQGGLERLKIAMKGGIPHTRSLPWGFALPQAATRLAGCVLRHFTPAQCSVSGLPRSVLKLNANHPSVHYYCQAGNHPLIMPSLQAVISH